MASGNRDVRYEYGKNGELLSVTDNGQRLKAEYRYDSMGREVLRIYGNGVRQETKYDKAGRVILIRETGAGNGLLRAEGYLYDGEGRRSHSVNEEGMVTKYQYDGQSRLAAVLYPWTEEKAVEDKREAEEAGLYFTPERGAGEWYSLENGELSLIREVLNMAGPNRGAMAGKNQLAWRESYEYDLNGNRASKKTPWGTVAYTYDKENRLTRKGDIAYGYDADGNMLREEGLRRGAEYRYDGRDRMVYSEVTSHTERTRTRSGYWYDGLGRRVLARDEGGEAMRTLYDGTGFEVIREGAVFSDGRFTTRYSNGAQSMTNTGTEGSRYRWVGEGSGDVRTRVIYEDGYSTGTGRYTGISVSLYGRGEAVAVSRSAGANGRGGTAYLGKDVLGSVRSTTNGNGSLEGRYEYDAFGKPYKGDLKSGMNLGYTGKPYDATTGLYNYGYRDYQPEAARFTTTDPIRDGANWFAYVNNDPVNYVDLWGLAGNCESDKKPNEKENPVIIEWGIPPFEARVYIFTYPGDDPNVPPGAGYEWKGNGDPASEKGNWVNPTTGAYWHPDLHHPPPVGPHWDYRDPGYNMYRVYPNGRYESK
jgi:RHS repeat-associated protein